VDNQKPRAIEEQLAYAAVLDIGMKIGFILLVVSFILYVFGIIEPHIAYTDLPKYWTMPVDEYLKATNIRAGWNWIELTSKSDFMNFIGMAFLATVTVICYLRILPIFFKNKDIVYCMIAIVEILVLVLAASDILTSNH
jgi:uncharacterized membrane protein